MGYASGNLVSYRAISNITENILTAKPVGAGKLTCGGSWSSTFGSSSSLRTSKHLAPFSAVFNTKRCGSSPRRTPISVQVSAEPLETYSGPKEDEPEGIDVPTSGCVNGRTVWRQNRPYPLNVVRVILGPNDIVLGPNIHCPVTPTAGYSARQPN